MSYYEWPYDYGDDVAIASRFGKDEAAKRVRDIVREVPGCLALALATSRTEGPELVGVVSSRKVMLARADPVARRAGKPVFYGSFVENQAGVTLRGRFSVNCLQRLLFWASSLTLAIFELGLLISVFLPENAPVFSVNNVGMVIAIRVLGGIGLALSYAWENKIVNSDREWVIQKLGDELEAHR
jgi:hypothetical protein